MNAQSLITTISTTDGCNAYFINAHRGMLIDSGHPDAGEQLLQKLQKEQITPDKISYLGVTHSHYDHAGATHILQEYAPHAQVIAASNSESYMNFRRRLRLYPEIDLYYPLFSYDILVDNLVELDLGDMQCQIFQTKGHSEDSISFYFPQLESIFTGDLIYKGVITQLETYQAINKSLQELEKSYNFLQELNPRVYYPGHGNHFHLEQKDFHSYDKKIRRFYKNNDLAYVNNFIPSIELFIHKYPGNKEEELIKTIYDFFMRPVTYNLFKCYSQESLHSLIEKALLLMKVLNMLKIEEGRCYLVNPLNAHL